MTDWSIEQARQTYNVALWSEGYFDIDATGHLLARPRPQQADLEDDNYKNTFDRFIHDSSIPARNEPVRKDTYLLISASMSMADEAGSSMMSTLTRKRERLRTYLAILALASPWSSPAPMVTTWGL